MSPDMFDADEITELVDLEIDQVDGVFKGANGFPFLVMKAATAMQPITERTNTMNNTDRPMSRREQLRRFGSYRPDGHPPMDNGTEDTLNALRALFGGGQVTKGAAEDGQDEATKLLVRLSTTLSLVAKAGGGATLSKTEQSGLKQALATLKGVLAGTLEPSALRQVSSLLQTIEQGVLGEPAPPAVPTDDGSATAAQINAGLDERAATVAKSQAALEAGRANLAALFAGQLPPTRPAPGPGPGPVAKGRARPLSMADVRAAAAKLGKRPARAPMPAIITSQVVRKRA